MDVIELTTTRIKLRRWSGNDYLPFAALNSDPMVMEYFPGTLSVTQSNRMADLIVSRLAERGWGFWALEIIASGEFAGFVGLNVPQAELPFSPCVEVGWRLAREFWGYGYASEAALEALRFGFEELGLDEIVSFTAARNRRSRAVMERLGMVNTQENFLHPDIDSGHPLCEHVLYKIERVV